VPDRLTRPAIAHGLLVVVVFSVVGVATGGLWEALWQAPIGVVYRDEWFLEPAGPDRSFSGTGLYVLLAMPVGAVLGVLAALVSRDEAVTLVAVLVGSVLAGWLMYAVGHTLGPPDPRVLAAGEPDLTELPADLVLAAPGDSRSPFRSTAFVAFPAGALAGLAIIYLSGFRAPRDR